MNLKSTAFTLQIRDFLKGAALAVIVPALLAIQQGLQNPPIAWKTIGIVSISTFIGYLLKNFFTNDVSAAEKTIDKAGGTVIPNMTVKN